MRKGSIKEKIYKGLKGDGIFHVYNGKIKITNLGLWHEICFMDFHGNSIFTAQLNKVYLEKALLEKEEMPCSFGFTT